MNRVLCVHGIGQQGKGENLLHLEWSAALRDGMLLAGCPRDQLPGPDDVTCVYYGDVFRPPGRQLGPEEPWLTAADTDQDDIDLLMAWWQSAAEADDGVIGPADRTLVRTPNSAQSALRALSGSRFFSGLADRVVLFDLQQVRRYLTDPQVRATVRGRLEAAVDDRSRIVVGHSLGSVVAYEALCAHPEWPVRTLVTLGSPLGIRNYIFDRLQPEPLPGAGGRPAGIWPGGITSWTNIADVSDVVALAKNLQPLFGPRVVNYLVHNGSYAHDVKPYLTAKETGVAILAGLARCGAE